MRNGRLPHVDAMRGLAVLSMLCMHTGDGWLAPAARNGQTWDLVRAVGGLGAPLFLLLSGTSLGIARAQRGGGAMARSELARGLQLVLLGYLLRVQMWLVDSGGYAYLVSWVGALLLTLGYAAAYRALAGWARREAPRRAGALAALSAAATAAGLAWIGAYLPHRLDGVLRQDILQAIGASLAITGWVTGRWGVRGALVLAPLVALLTAPMRSWVPGPLPPALAAYLAHFPSDGSTPNGLFPLFPWLSYPLVGYALGQRWGRVGRAGAEEHAVMACAGGALLALASCELLEPVRSVMDAWPWAVQPLRVLYRVGMVLALGGLALFLSREGFPLRRPLQSLGRASLCVYWVHLPFAYGVLSRPLHRALSPEEWLVWLVSLTVAMVAIAELWFHRARFTSAVWRPAVSRPTSSAISSL